MVAQAWATAAYATAPRWRAVCSSSYTPYGPGAASSTASSRSAASALITALASASLWSMACSPRWSVIRPGSGRAAAAPDDMQVASHLAPSSSVHDQLPLELELAGERGVAGQAQDLELAVGPLPALDHPAPVGVQPAGAHGPDDRRSVA